MSKQYNTEPVKKALETAKTVLVLLPQNPSLDTVAAGLSIFLSFTQAQKNTSVGCASDMTVNFNRLFGVDKIKTRIGNQNLVVSFNYNEDSLEKVSYDKDPQNQKFHLTIEPKAGFNPLDPNQVEFSYTGSNADLIFVINANSLEDLGALYEQEKALLDNKQKTLINLSTLDKNAQFGTVNLYDPTAAGASEIVLNVLKTLNLPLDQDIATNLLAGIESATNNLSSANSPETYETIAELIRLGAKKGHLTPQAPRPFPVVHKPSVNPSGMNIPETTKPFSKIHPANAGPQPMPAMPPMPPRPQTPIPKPATPHQPFPSQPPTNNLGANAPKATKNDSKLYPANAGPQPDWLKPKVITSSGVKI